MILQVSVKSDMRRMGQLVAKAGVQSLLNPEPGSAGSISLDVPAAPM